jgi:hypothetical protein
MCQFYVSGVDTWLVGIGGGGVLLGFCCYRAKTLSTLIVGVVAGIVPGLIVYEAFAYKVYPESRGPLYILTLLTASAGGFLCLKVGAHMLIMATAISGAYMLLRVFYSVILQGLSVFWGEYPNEMLLSVYIRNKEMEDVR